MNWLIFGINLRKIIRMNSDDYEKFCEKSKIWKNYYKNFHNQYKFYKIILNCVNWSMVNEY